MSDAALSMMDRPSLSLFVPSDNALGDVHAMSFRDGVLVDCRIIRPSYIQGIKWLLLHYIDEDQQPHRGISSDMVEPV